jgi:type II secretory pathway predicted ATPase ExeA
MLLYTLLELLEKRRFVTGLCTNPTLSKEEFFDFVLERFGVDCPSSLKNRQLAALQEGLSRNQAEGKPCLLIVDEAQRLSPELLEEIRLLLNLETPDRKLLEIIMAGQPELMDTLRRPEFRQLKQRVSYFCKLEPLNLGELGEYITHRLDRAGVPNQTLFPKPVVQAVYSYTKGIPRLVNTLCDNALQAGFALQSPHITLSIVEDAAKDLDMLTERPRVDHLDGEGRLANPFLVGSSQSHSPSNGSSAERPPQSDKVSPAHIPLESYEARQGSLGFFARLVGRRG